MGSASEPSLQNKQNFRSCGRFAQKVLPVHAGTTRQPDAVPTIPSRIETTLHKGKRERNGFGSQSLRFNANPDSGIDPDGPGPGIYGQPKSSIEDLGQQFGWGKRGTGGFASRSRRFGARSLPTLPTFGRGCPGPGQYDATSVVNKLKDRSDFLQGKNTAVFAESAPEAKSAVLRSWAPPLPGPGQYKNALAHPAKPHISSIPSFKSGSKRCEAGPEPGLDDPAAMPGPGAYYSRKPILPPDGSGHSGSNAVFKGVSERRYCQVHKDLPVADQKARKALGDFASVVSKECVGQRLTDLPGPGIYDQDRDSMWRGADCGVHGMSSFLPGPRRTDWGSGESALMPGPGGYDPKSLSNLKLTDAKSGFISGTEQHTFADMAKGPGPCYYKPPSLKLDPKTSFILNSRKRFL